MRHYFLLLSFLLTGISTTAQIELYFKNKHIKVEEKETRKDEIHFFYGDDDKKLFNCYKSVLKMDAKAKKAFKKKISQIDGLDYSINESKDQIKFTYNKQTVTLSFKNNSFTEIDNKTSFKDVIAVYTADGKQTIVEINGEPTEILFYDGDINSMNLVPLQKLVINNDFFTGHDGNAITFDIYKYKIDDGKKIITFFTQDDKKIKTIKLKNSVLSEYTTEDEYGTLQIITSIEVNNGCENCQSEGNKVTYDFATDKISTNFPALDKNNKAKKDKNDNIKQQKRPWVTQPMEFIVKGYNPFKYDVSLSEEVKNYNTEQPSLFTTAMTPKTGVTAATLEASERGKLELVMGQLKKLLDEKLSQLKNGKDCYNPCAEVKKIVDGIDAYLKKVYDGEFTTDPTTFLTTKITDNFNAKDDDDKKKMEEFDKILNSYRELTTTAMGDYVYKIPFIKNVDEYIFKLNITPKKGSNGTARLINQEIPVSILGGFKVDFSTGLYYTSLVNEKFSLVKDSVEIANTDPVEYNKRKKIIRENDSNRDFGLSALMHVYTRLTTWINPALTIGVGTTLNEKPRLQYLMGGSLIFGKNGRLVMTYGATMGYIDQLSSRYKDMYDADGNLYVSQYDKEVSLNKNFRIKPFFSLTYNIPIFGSKTEEVTGSKDKEATSDEATKKEESDSKEEDSSEDTSEEDSDKKALKKAIKVLSK